MGVSTETRRRQKELIPTKVPTSRERALYFLAAPVIGLMILALTLIFDWSKATMLAVALAVGSVYVLVATPLLLGRRADR